MQHTDVSEPMTLADRLDSNDPATRRAGLRLANRAWRQGRYLSNSSNTSFSLATSDPLREVRDHAQSVAIAGLQRDGYFARVPEVMAYQMRDDVDVANADGGYLSRDSQRFRRRLHAGEWPWLDYPWEADLDAAELPPLTIGERKVRVIAQPSFAPTWIVELTPSGEEHGCANRATLTHMTMPTVHRHVSFVHQ